MAEQIELERVRRRSGGRVHLTPHVPESGRVTTLCGQTFAEGTYESAAGEADCRNCLRRRNDPARVSSAFFQSELGSRLLERSLEEARARRPARPRRAEPRPAAETPAASPPGPATPAQSPASRRPAAAQPAEVRIAELRSPTPLRRAFENVYLSPDGVILRLARDGSLSEVAFTGAIDVRRRGRVLTIRVGDVTIEFLTS